MRNHLDMHTGGIPQDALGVNDEETTEGDTLFLDQDAVISGDLHVTVCKERQLEIGAETALFTRLVGPRKVGILRVGGYGKNLGVELLEQNKAIIEGKDFRWTNESKVPEEHKLIRSFYGERELCNAHRIEEQNDPVCSWYQSLVI